MHWFPYSLGAGLSHWRNRSRIPLPQVREHSPDHAHTPHPPCTGKTFSLLISHMCITYTCELYMPKTDTYLPMTVGWMYRVNEKKNKKHWTHFVRYSSLYNCLAEQCINFIMHMFKVIWLSSYPITKTQCKKKDVIFVKRIIYNNEVLQNDIK